MGYSWAGRLCTIKTTSIHKRRYHSNRLLYRQPLLVGQCQG
ncbi:hypothetical protein FOFC_08926 [Fusarium oxysporum]|nr:hypothetical protein FOFC_08248 [Fusarium oxysporum]KAI8412296.1 hypothetical protein FOFC_08926 [Fusarium oxysporum]